MRSIDADALIKAIINMPPNGIVFDCIHEAPTIESERKTGKWLFNNLNDGNGIVYHCSCCNWLTKHNQYAYCPNCGADMRGEDE